ncbi:unnamed protein product [Boreogadus saida]
MSPQIGLNGAVGGPRSGGLPEAPEEAYSVISTISQRSNPHPTFSSSYQTCGGRASIHNITLLKLKHSETSADLPFNEGQFQQQVFPE